MTNCVQNCDVDVMVSEQDEGTSKNSNHVYTFRIAAPCQRPARSVIRMISLRVGIMSRYEDRWSLGGRPRGPN